MQRAAAAVEGKKNENSSRSEWKKNSVQASSRLTPARNDELTPPRTESEVNEKRRKEITQKNWTESRENSRAHGSVCYQSEEKFRVD
jgi:hypothetical protein